MCGESKRAGKKEGEKGNKKNNKGRRLIQDMAQSGVVCRYRGLHKQSAGEGRVFLFTRASSSCGKLQVQAACSVAADLDHTWLM